MQKKSSSKLLGILLLLFLLALLLPVLVELLFRVLKPQSEEFSIAKEYTQTISGLSDKVSWKKNFLGLRSNSINSIAKPSNTIRVICLGDSTTEQGTHNLEETWMSLLANKLQAEYPSIHFEFGSYAREGLGIVHATKWSKQRMKELSPDVVISLFGLPSLLTDEQLMAQGVDFDDLKQYIETPPSGLRYRILKHSLLARWAARRVQSMRLARALKPLKGQNPRIARLPALNAQHWKAPFFAEPLNISSRLFGKKTLYLARYLKSLGIEHILLGQPLLHHEDMSYASLQNSVTLNSTTIMSNASELEKAKLELSRIYRLIHDGSKPVRLNPPLFLAEMQRFNHTQQKIAEREELIYVNLEDRIEPNLENFYDGAHYTKQGSRRISEEVYPYLKSKVDDVLATHAKEVME